MNKDDVVSYKGDARRLAGGDELQIDGTFRAVEQRDVDGSKRWLVEDVRRKELLDGVDEPDPDAHRYLLPATYTDTPAPASDPQLDAFRAGVEYANERVAGMPLGADELGDDATAAAFADWRASADPTD